MYAFRGRNTACFAEIASLALCGLLIISCGTYRSAVEECFYNDNVECMQELLFGGLDPNYNINSESNSSLLISASMLKQKDMVELLVDSGANVNQRDARGRTALYYSVGVDSEEISEYLIDHGADVLATTNDRDTVLHAASWGFGDNARLVQDLIGHGANPYQKNVNGTSALDIAKEKGKHNLIHTFEAFSENLPHSGVK